MRQKGENALTLLFRELHMDSLEHKRILGTISTTLEH